MDGGKKQQKIKQNETESVRPSVVVFLIIYVVCVLKCYNIVKVRCYCCKKEAR